jgi:hypothetical protein
LRRSHVASSRTRTFAHSTDFADFFARLGREVPQSRDAFLAWLLERCLVPESLWADGAWLDEYLRRRLAATRAAGDPIASFVPVADPDRLRRAWIDQAPDPIAEPCRSPADAIAAEVDAMRRSTSWRLTAPMRALVHTCRAALSGSS